MVDLEVDLSVNVTHTKLLHPQISFFLKYIYMPYLFRLTLKQLNIRNGVNRTKVCS